MKFSGVLSLAFAGLAAAQNQSRNLTQALNAENGTLSLINLFLATQPGLVRTLNSARNVTLLAPSNDALRSALGIGNNDNSPDFGDGSMLTALLTYHVLNGTYYASNFTGDSQFIPTHLTNSTYTNVTTGQRVEARMESDTVSFYSGLRTESNVTQANLNFTGGVIHVINKVLSIPKNVSQVAVAAQLSALAGALGNDSSVLNNVQSLRNITVFAPNNGAFARIANLAGNLSSDDITRILEYHVVEGTVGYSTDLTDGMKLETVEGSDVTISTDNDNIFVNGARVVTPNILIANGVVHVIDGVLNPDNANATGNAGTTTAAFSGASTATDGQVPFTSGVMTATEEATNLNTATSTEAGPQMTAAVAMGALFGGAAMMMNF